jgi:hypothetical protein
VAISSNDGGDCCDPVRENHPHCGLTMTDRPESIRGKFSNLFKQVADELSLESLSLLAPEFIQV